MIPRKKTRSVSICTENNKDDNLYCGHIGAIYVSLLDPRFKQVADRQHSVHPLWWRIADEKGPIVECVRTSVQRYTDLSFERGVGTRVKLWNGGIPLKSFLFLFCSWKDDNLGVWRVWSKMVNTSMLAWNRNWLTNETIWSPLGLAARFLQNFKLSFYHQSNTRYERKIGINQN